MDTKVIAFYLPQFHSIPENDSWWGDGFTEWVNVKKSKSLFSGHVQPRIPLHENYYNLLDLKAQEWQAKIAKDHGIGGFCYYHYWFEGDQLLEKPAENMLKSPSVDIPFCFSWANHDWTRTWGGPGKNQLLKKQTYGNKESWIRHFEYLLDFFKDERYIKIQNKPVFLIYNTSQIEDIDLMLKDWDKLAIENGFDGIYLIETMNSYQKESKTNYSQGMMIFEPLYTFQNELSLWHKVQLSINYIFQSVFNYTPIVLQPSYDYVWNKILSRDIRKQVKSFFCGFVDWDNSPRRGRTAYATTGSSPKKFGKYMRDLIKKSQYHGSNEIIFINAWNEWAEGAYLEPDTLHKFEYLNEIKILTKEII